MAAPNFAALSSEELPIRTTGRSFAGVDLFQQCQVGTRIGTPTRAAATPIGQANKKWRSAPAINVLFASERTILDRINPNKRLWSLALRGLRTLLRKRAQRISRNIGRHAFQIGIDPGTAPERATGLFWAVLDIHQAGETSSDQLAPPPPP